MNSTFLACNFTCLCSEHQLSTSRYICWIRSTARVLDEPDFLRAPHAAARRAWDVTGRCMAPNGALMRAAATGLRSLATEGTRSDHFDSPPHSFFLVSPFPLSTVDRIWPKLDSSRFTPQKSHEHRPSLTGTRSRPRGRRCQDDCFGDACRPQARLDVVEERKEGVLWEGPPSLPIIYKCFDVSQGALFHSVQPTCLPAYPLQVWMSPMPKFGVVPQPLRSTAACVAVAKLVSLMLETGPRGQLYDW